MLTAEAHRSSDLYLDNGGRLSPALLVLPPVDEAEAEDEHGCRQDGCAEVGKEDQRIGLGGLGSEYREEEPCGQQDRADGKGMAREGPCAGTKCGSST
jgi:hypothetical protein